MCREVWDPLAVIAKLHGVCWVEGKNRHFAVPGGNIQADTLKTTWISWECMLAISSFPVKNIWLMGNVKEMYFWLGMVVHTCNPSTGRQRQEDL